MNAVVASPRATHRAILVLGMHRSGTSAVTRCLNLLGVDLGKRLLPPVEGNNPRGFWENADVVAIHEELLGALGRSWHDTRALPKNWLSTSAALDARGRLAELIRNDFGDSALWAVKDPRLCRLLPLWKDLLAELEIDASALLVVRHPAEVADSLEKRNDLPGEAVYLSWLEHLSEAEAGSRGMRRSVMSYEGLLSDWRRGLTRVARDLHVEWPVPMAEAGSHIATFLDAKERHHAVATATSGMPEVLDRLYRLFRAQESGACDWQEIASLVDIATLMRPAIAGNQRTSSENPHPARSKQATLGVPTTGPEGPMGYASAQAPASSGLDYAAVYYRSDGQAYDDRRSRQVPFDWAQGKPLVQRFEVPHGASMVRFDPSTRSGAFNLCEMQVNEKAVGNLRARVRGVNQYVLDRLGGRGAWFASNDNDPWLELDVSDLAAADEPLIIQMRCVRRPLESVLGALLASISDDFQQRLHASVASSLAPVAGHLSSIHDGLSKRVETLQVRGAELEQELAAGHERERKLQQTVDALHARESQLHQTNHALQTHSVELEGELASGRSRVRRLTAAMAWQLGEASKSRRDSEQLASAMSVLQTEAAGYRGQVASLQRELAEIHASTLWRVLLRLRALLLLLPQGLRTGLRRVFKAGWWVMTPWRTLARLRFIRARRHTLESSSSGEAPPLQSDASAPDGQDVVPLAKMDAPVLSAGYAYRDPDPDPLVIRDNLLGLSHPTFFSVVVPVYNTDPHLLRKTIASVQAQWYPDWELILVDDHSSSVPTREVLESLTDPRIAVVRLNENKRISGATNEGLRRAGGDYIVFLDHDDELTPDCLYELALCIDRDNPDYLYSDEDKLGVDGRFAEPFFKPDWSPDTMMSIMLTCHVSCVRRTLALEVGGLRSEYDGSQDWDFVLRVTERAGRISHIPKVLYHWRTIPESCASDLQAKPYAVLASKAAREDALRRRGLSGELVPVAELPGYYRTHYHLQGKPLFSIVIPTRNNGKVLKTCIDSIFKKSAYRNFEILVINNGSTDAETLEYLATLCGRDQVNVLDHDVPFNYSEINNYGVRHVAGELLVFLNDDTEIISPDWLDYMGGYAQLPHVGAVGAKLLYPGTLTVQHTGVVNFLHGPDHAFRHIGAGDPGYFCRNLLEHNWIAVTGACLMIQRKKFDAVGGFDEDLAVAYNDVALGFSLVEHGWYQVVCPSIQLLHYESLSRGDDRLDPEKLARIGREQAILYRKHPDFKGRDPFHSANFIPDDLLFGIPLSYHTI